MPRSAARSSRSRSSAANARVGTACRSDGGHRSRGVGRVEQVADHRVLLGAGEQPRRRLAPLGRGEAEQAERVRREGAHDRLGHGRVRGRWPSRASIRLRSAAAVRRPKVSTRMWAGSTPSATRAATASTRAVVLPVPGPPTTSSGPDAMGDDRGLGLVERRGARAASASEPRPAGSAARGPSPRPPCHRLRHARYATTTRRHPRATACRPARLDQRNSSRVAVPTARFARNC